MTEERVNIGNVKTIIGLQKTQVLSDVLGDYYTKTEINDLIGDAITYINQ